MSDRIEELLTELATLDRPCSDEDEQSFRRLDCLSSIHRVGQLIHHTDRCHRASRQQKVGLIYDQDEHWRKYFAWRAAHESTGILYGDWLDEAGEQDPKFREAIA